MTRPGSKLSTALRDVRITLEMIKIEHTLFALPFAFLGAVLAARGLPSISQLFWITLAMVGARSAAMAFNRIADREYDARTRASGACQHSALLVHKTLDANVASSAWLVPFNCADRSVDCGSRHARQPCTLAAFAGSTSLDRRI